MNKYSLSKFHDDILPLEKIGVKWSGVMYTCGFYRIRTLNSHMYLEKFSGYKYGRAVYEDISSINYYGGFEIEVIDEEVEVFKHKVKMAVRESKLSRINGVFKKDESYYQNLHHRNK